MNNETVNQVVKIATIAGAAVLAVSAAMQLTKVKSVKEGVMPVVSILVAVAAYRYASKSTVVVASKIV